MKKTVTIFLCVLYLVMSSGFTTYTHFCKGVKQEMNFSNADNRSDLPCSVCASKDKGLQKKKKGCCKHQSKVVKVTDSVQKKTGKEFNLKFWGGAIPNRTIGAVFDVTFETAPNIAYPIASATPGRRNPLYILHCVYRI